MAFLQKVKSVFRPELAVIAYAGTRPIGIMIGIPDYNRVLRASGGRRDPVSWLLGRLVVAHIDTARCPMQYVVPEYQNKAVNAAMYYHAAQGAKRIGVRQIEGSTVDETHIASINNTLLAGGKQYRVYRRYQKAL